MPESFPDLTKAIEEFTRKHNLAIDGLTEKQTAEVIAQAIASGDIMRHVRVEPGLDHAQAVTYVPLREAEHLKCRIRLLEKLLQYHGIEAEFTENDH